MLNFKTITLVSVSDLTYYLFFIHVTSLILATKKEMIYITAGMVGIYELTILNVLDPLVVDSMWLKKFHLPVVGFIFLHFLVSLLKNKIATLVRENINLKEEVSQLRVDFTKQLESMKGNLEHEQFSKFLYMRNTDECTTFLKKIFYTSFKETIDHVFNFIDEKDWFDSYKLILDFSDKDEIYLDLRTYKVFKSEDFSVEGFSKNFCTDGNDRFSITAFYLGEDKLDESDKLFLNLILTFAVRNCPINNQATELISKEARVTK